MRLSLQAIYNNRQNIGRRDVITFPVVLTYFNLYGRVDKAVSV